MLNEDYVDFIRRKYRLAIVIAVIKTKPKKKTMEEHINNLKRNYIELNSCNISVCEEDFNLSDNESDRSVTILKDFEVNIVENVVQTETVCSKVTEHRIETSASNVPDINSQSTYCETPNNSYINLDDNTYFTLTQDLNMNTNPTNDLRVTTEFYNELTDKYTHISQSQDSFVISEKYLISKNVDKNDKTTNVRQNKLNYNNDLKDITNLNVNNVVEAKKLDAIVINDNSLFRQDLHLTELCSNSSQSILANNINLDNADLFPLDLSSKTNDNDLIKKSKNLTPFSQNLNELEYFNDSSQITLNPTINKSNNINKCNLEREITNTKDKMDRKRKGSEINLDQNNNVEHSRRIIDLEVNKDPDIEDFNSIRDVTESQVEVVTFKVLEELNKVKNYLNRRERENERWRNSQLDNYSRVSDTMSMSVSSVSESAQCLLRHITSSPLLSRTAHITSRVADVLGDLINALHEDEKYPSFLETLLEAIDSVLRYIYLGDNCEENIIIKKEEAINRIFLLNKSQYIIEYTIQKITAILNEFIQDVKNERFEVQFPDKAENVCHILNVLQVILKRYTHIQTQTQNTQKSVNVSQSQSVSQELKKSALTDIWRKKFSIDKESVSDKSVDNSDKCLKECGKVLRFLLVEGMNGFNLIAFCALTCYNLLQN